MDVRLQDEPIGQGEPISRLDGYLGGGTEKRITELVRSSGHRDGKSRRGAAGLTFSIVTPSPDYQFTRISPPKTCGSPTFTVPSVRAWTMYSSSNALRAKKNTVKRSAS